MNFDARRRPASSRDNGSESEDPRASRLSRFLALVLRHRAYQFDLEMDDEGFVPLEPLIEVIHTRDNLDAVARMDLEELAAAGPRKRFEIRDDRIRATYGHSFHKPIRYRREEPPENLYLGVPKSHLQQIRVSGLHPEDRQYVHLSESEEEARDVGLRKADDTSVVTVRAREAAENGIEFFHPTDGLFLASQVPARYLDVQASFGRHPRKARRR